MTAETLSPKQVAFEIRFALGQTGATHFINAHAKSPEARLRALDALTAIVAARFDTLVVTRELPRNWDAPLCGPAISEGMGNEYADQRQQQALGVPPHDRARGLVGPGSNAPRLAVDAIIREIR